MTSCVLGISKGKYLTSFHMQNARKSASYIPLTGRPLGWCWSHVQDMSESPSFWCYCEVEQHMQQDVSVLELLQTQTTFFPFFKKYFSYMSGVITKLLILDTIQMGTTNMKVLQISTKFRDGAYSFLLIHSITLKLKHLGCEWELLLKGTNFTFIVILI